MSGAADLLATAIFCLIFVVAVVAVLTRVADWNYRRAVKRVRKWVLTELDSQIAKIDQNKHCSELKEHLSVVLDWSTDLEKLKRVGLPVLLVLPQDMSRDPYLLLGVVPADKKLDLGDGSVIGNMPDARPLTLEEIALLKKFYPERPESEFYCYTIIRTDREVARESKNQPP